MFLEGVGRDLDGEDAVEDNEAVLIVEVGDDNAPEVDQVDLTVAADDPVKFHV